MRYEVITWKHSGRDYDLDLGRVGFEAKDDAEAKAHFFGQDWREPEGGNQQHELMAKRNGAQGDEQCIAVMQSTEEKSQIKIEG